MSDSWPEARSGALNPEEVFLPAHNLRVDCLPCGMWIYIYIYVVCVCIYIYIYIYMMCS